MSELEREVKLTLPSEAAYARLCRLLPDFEGEVEQRNSYWDAPDRRWRDRGVMVRLRIAGTRAYVTVKQAAKVHDDGLFEAPEEEVDVDFQGAMKVVRGEATLASLECPLIAARSEPGQTWECWGRMENRRRRYRLNPEFVVEVDRTIFLDRHVEWEVELESTDPAEAGVLLRKALDDAGVSYTPQTVSKSERLARYLEREGETS